ncbi:GNAT family N-acetyltransferase [Bacteroides propionicifaciens]|jgi:uncharacterized protein|uniref:GNAT family N-acetyltransferase n=1 Tax=Bacteroides propionicifaciens TaxID=392838 RepID=UPI00037E6D9B|nr:GNAT family N-acetyltransferase [Bacteroides propionicifaciens]
MNYIVEHKPSIKRFEADIEGQVAYVEYTLHNDEFDIIHTIVPKELEGQGIAARIVSEAYAYAKDAGYTLKASCSYAKVWLKRHPL